MELTMDINNRVLASTIRQEILTLLSKQRTRTQLLFHFNYLLASGELEGAKYFFQMLRLTNTDQDLVQEIEHKLKSLTKKEGN
jgi:hypothetical protein